MASHVSTAFATCSSHALSEFPEEALILRRLKHWKDLEPVKTSRFSCQCRPRLQFATAISGPCSAVTRLFSPLGCPGIDEFWPTIERGLHGMAMLQLPKNLAGSPDIRTSLAARTTSAIRHGGIGSG